MPNLLITAEPGEKENVQEILHDEFPGAKIKASGKNEISLNIFSLEPAILRGKVEGIKGISSFYWESP